MQKITPFLTFDGHAEAAARLYVSLLPDSRINGITMSPMAPGSVMTVDFTLAGLRYTALNAPGFVFTEAVSFTIACDDQAEVDRLWDALTAEGGAPIACGWLKDRWGVRWQITPKRLIELITDPDPARARRAMESMMGMTKIDIAELERAVAAG